MRTSARVDGHHRVAKDATITERRTVQIYKKQDLVSVTIALKDVRIVTIGLISRYYVPHRNVQKVT